jgi:hypothetical protein
MSGGHCTHEGSLLLPALALGLLVVPLIDPLAKAVSSLSVGSARARKPAGWRSVQLPRRQPNPPWTPVAQPQERPGAD